MGERELSGSRWVELRIISSSQTLPSLSQKTVKFSSPLYYFVPFLFHSLSSPSLTRPSTLLLSSHYHPFPTCNCSLAHFHPRILIESRHRLAIWHMHLFRTKLHWMALVGPVHISHTHLRRLGGCRFCLVLQPRINQHFKASRVLSAATNDCVHLTHLLVL